MKLDANVLRYLSRDDFRVLTAVEMGQKNHQIVPISLIDSISGLKHGGAYKCLRELLKHKLVHHENAKYDGYRLTYQGYDFLALRVLTARGHISGVGRQIGVGKESDIYEVSNEEGEVFALKLHRLGRTSFRAVKNKRDYLGTRTSFSWLYLSRLAALKEYAFMQALWDSGFPVPQAIDHNRHAVLMTLVKSYPMVQVNKLVNPGQVYLTCMELISRLASKGLIHCDFNEFNLLINDEEELTLIDFPQMVSVSHANAQDMFDRDVECIVKFFTRKIGYAPERDPALPYVRPSLQEAVTHVDEKLDVGLAASGFKKKHQRALEEAFLLKKEGGEEGGSGSGSEEEGSSGSGDEGAEGEGAGEGGRHGKRAGVASNLEAAQAVLADAQGDCDEAGSRQGAHPGGGDGGTAHEAGGHGCSTSSGGSSEGGEGSSGSSSSEGGEVSESERELKERLHARRDLLQRKKLEQLTQKAAHVTIADREVQQTLVAQRRKEAKKNALTSASRNTAKAPQGKGGRKNRGIKAGGSGADFAGW